MFLPIFESNIEPPVSHDRVNFSQLLLANNASGGSSKGENPTEEIESCEDSRKGIASKNRRLYVITRIFFKKKHSTL